MGGRFRYQEMAFAYLWLVNKKTKLALKLFVLSRLDILKLIKNEI